MNKYEFAHRAMALMDSIECGPDGKFCDGGKPTYRCPAHGGQHDDETASDVAARELWSERWAREVMS